MFFWDRQAKPSIAGRLSDPLVSFFSANTSVKLAMFSFFSRTYYHQAPEGSSYHQVGPFVVESVMTISNTQRGCRENLFSCVLGISPHSACQKQSTCMY